SDYIRCIKPRESLDANGERVGGWWFKVPGSAEFGWPDEMMPLATILYKYVRNSLAHEGGLPTNVEFIEDKQAGFVSFEVLPDRLRISNLLMAGLGRSVTFAPENGDLFPDIGETPPDVLAWNIFRNNRDQQKPYLEQRALRVERI